jgi:hypothetical protein
MKAIRIPGLVDLVRADTPDEILALSRDPRLDRDFVIRGPLLNRLVLGRIRRVLQLDGRPLPPVAPANYPGRAADQAMLETNLQPFVGAPAQPTTLHALAAYILGEGRASAAGRLAQEATGQLFDPAYRATGRSWRDAKVLAGSAQSLLSLRVFLWQITGRLGVARKRLAAMVGDDRSGLHATGVAVHNLVQSLERMRILAAEPGALARYAPAEAASLCLSAPARIVRQAKARGSVGLANFRAGALILFQLEEAREPTLRPDMAFMSQSWSHCPARFWVPALLAAIWAAAQAMPGQP